MKYYTNLFVLIFSGAFLTKVIAGDSAIRLIMRADDMGFSRSANIAITEAYQKGIITTTEVIVPGPWFLDAAALLKDNPDLDVGVHLTLNSEWLNYKWGPLTKAASLVDSDGYFPLTAEALLANKINLDEVEKELRTQVEMAIEYIPQVSHLSAHMGTATATPELTAVVNRLSAEYNLPFYLPVGAAVTGIWEVDSGLKKKTLENMIRDLKPGITMIVCHPIIKNAETDAITGSGHDANVNMSTHRQIVLEAVTSNEIKEAIKQQNIKLIRFKEAF